MSKVVVNFEKIELGHKDRINVLRNKYKHTLSSHAFTSLYLWQDKMKLSIYLTDKMFCVKREDYSDRNYFFPCGDENEKINFINALMEMGAVSFQYVREQDIMFLEKYFPGRFEFNCSRDDWEYIYNKEEQIGLAGSSFKHLRSKVHKGENAHNWTIAKLSKDNTYLAAEITRKWNDEIKHNGESADMTATLNALKYFDELNLSGIVLLADETPLAFALGTVISGNTYDLHISKTLESDIDCYLKWELFRQLPDRILYINREEDLGILGLRVHKMEMKPVRFNELWEGRIK